MFLNLEFWILIWKLNFKEESLMNQMKENKLMELCHILELFISHNSHSYHFSNIDFPTVFSFLFPTLLGRRRTNLDVIYHVYVVVQG